MRPKISEDKKRGLIIGIKVDKLTRKKIKYIAARDDTPVSTYLYNVINKHIEEYAGIAKINWEIDLNEDEG